MASSVRTWYITVPAHPEALPPTSGPVIPPHYQQVWFLKLPNLYHYLVRTIRIGYAIQFVLSPHCFRGIHCNAMGGRLGCNPKVVIAPPFMLPLLLEKIRDRCVAQFAIWDKTSQGAMRPSSFYTGDKWLHLCSKMMLVVTGVFGKLPSVCVGYEADNSLNNHCGISGEEASRRNYSRRNYRHTIVKMEIKEEPCRIKDEDTEEQIGEEEASRRNYSRRNYRHTIVKMEIKEEPCRIKDEDTEEQIESNAAPHFRFWRWGSETGGAAGLQLDTIDYSNRIQRLCCLEKHSINASRSRALALLDSMLRTPRSLSLSSVVVDRRKECGVTRDMSTEARASLGPRVEPPLVPTTFYHF
ncbi:hypothetical protein F2P79_022784 [Pimephales promelas]|nr:hypothetical protein F2P79_022784 [Pimephales promelas]